MSEPEERRLTGKEFQGNRLTMRQRIDRMVEQRQARQVEIDPDYQEIIKGYSDRVMIDTNIEDYSNPTLKKDEESDYKFIARMNKELNMSNI